MKSKVKILSAVGLTLLAVGCGSSAQQVATDGGPAGVPAGGGLTGGLTGKVCSTTNQITNSAGVVLCRETYGPVNISFSGNNAADWYGNLIGVQMRPGDPNIGQSVYSLISVRRHDRVRVNSVSGYYGTVQTSTSSLGPIDFNFSTLNCSQNTFTSSVGLAATDGTLPFSVAKGSNRSFEVQNDGILRFGISLPSNVAACGSALLSGLTITRCSDSAGNPYPCP